MALGSAGLSFINYYDLAAWSVSIVRSGGSGTVTPTNTANLKDRRLAAVATITCTSLAGGAVVQINCAGSSIAYCDVAALIGWADSSASMSGMEFRIQGYSDAAFATQVFDSGTVEIFDADTFASGYNVDQTDIPCKIMHTPPDRFAIQSLRITISRNAALGQIGTRTLTVGRLWIGGSARPATGAGSKSEFSAVDPSDVQESHGSQAYPNEFPRKWKLKLDFPALTTLEAFGAPDPSAGFIPFNIATAFRRNGMFEDVFAWLNDNTNAGGSSSTQIFLALTAVYGRIVAWEPIKFVEARDAAGRVYRCSVTVEEER